MIDYSNRITPNNITTLGPNEIFVFGSNEQGMHAGGAAKFAMNFGAEWGNGFGIQGNTFAIPTLSFPGGTESHRLSVEEIGKYVKKFIQFAKRNKNLKFYVTEIGCGIAGFAVQQIAPLFENAINIENICLPESFWNYLIDKDKIKEIVAEAIKNELRKYL